jgi:hypothetical protein
MKVKAKAEAASSTIRIKTGILKGLVLGAGNPMDLIPRLETGENLRLLGRSILLR